MRILVVDDSKAMRMIVSRCLKKAGLGDLEIIEACNGKEGLSTAKEKSPDIVLTDWNMPEMSGLELIRAIRDEELNLKVGVVTSDVGGQTKSEAEEAGALFVIRKPFTAETFKSHIDMAFGRTAAGAGNGQLAVAASSADQLPDAKTIANTLSGLLPRPAEVSGISKVDIKKDSPVAIATFGYDDEVHGICACEFKTAMGLAAAMTLFSKGVVDEGVKNREVPEGLSDNVGELFNVLGSLFARSTLKQTILPPEKSPLLVRQQLKAAKERIDVKVTITGYDTGWLVVALL